MTEVEFEKVVGETKTELLYALLNSNKWYIRLRVMEGIRGACHKKEQAFLDREAEAEVEAAFADLAYREGLIYEEFKERETITALERKEIIYMLEELASRVINSYLAKNR